MLQTKVDAQCDKLATVELRLQHLRPSTSRDEKAEKSDKFKVWEKTFQKETPLLLEIPELS